MPRVSGTGARFAIEATATADGYVAALAWAPDGGTLAVAGDGGGVDVLDVRTGALRRIGEHAGGALAVAWSCDGVLASGGRDGQVAFAGVPMRRNGATSARRHGGGPWIERLTWRPDGGRLAAACGRHVEFLTPGGACEDVSEPLPATVSCLDWHPKGVLCAAGSYGGVRLLRANGGRVAQRLNWTGSVLELAFSPDGRRLAHGNQDASVHFWDLRRNRELEMTGYDTKVRELAWSPDARWLATGGGSEVTLWDFARAGGPAGSRPVQLQHADRVTALAFQPHGSLLAAADRHGTILLWQPDQDDLPIGGSALDQPVTRLAWSPDGRQLAASGADGAVAVTAVAVQTPEPAASARR